MKKSKHIVYPPEYYLEIPEKDVRLAVKACNGFMNTIKMAEFSLRSVKILADEELDNIVINIAHLRHAIEDLNNSFDLLLQIPWMHYRIWEAFNHSGCLRKGRLKNKCEIERNSDCWVLKAEENCNEKKVIAFMKVHYRNRCDMIKGFYNHYINTFLYLYIPSH